MTAHARERPLPPEGARPASGRPRARGLKPRHLRLLGLLAMLGLLALAGGLVLQAFRKNLVFFVTPSEIVQGRAPLGERFRLGGLVAPGSVQRSGGSLRFSVTDGAQQVVVRYRGVLPDLFREGKGVVAQGRLAGLEFVADEVLAKHDENYMPPEAAAALQKAGQP
jgi:cytochrome c-type biogenesis protein CcmE|mmetsp:Transcript_68794/g.161819  ORF Transcript_68794/g.161819 Transcript_68794/m.161819 type:complete len:166 (-) Transcript_68794:2191-2688(-)